MLLLCKSNSFCWVIKCLIYRLDGCVYGLDSCLVDNKIDSNFVANLNAA